MRDVDPLVAKSIAGRTGAPESLCRQVLEELADDLEDAWALVVHLLGGFLPQPRPLAQRELSELKESLDRARADGKAAADRDIESGRAIHLGYGLVPGSHKTCPNCMTRREGEHRSCLKCGGEVIEFHSTGCVVGVGTSFYTRAYNACVEEHIRETVNPGFRWADVREIRRKR